jgi:GDP-L-fucose synthase
LLAVENYNGSEPVNIGTGTEIFIKDLVDLIASQTSFTGQIRWDLEKPDGQPRRSLDVQRGAVLSTRGPGFTAGIPVVLPRASLGSYVRTG